MLIRNGCLIEAFKRKEIDSIGHQANCVHKMGAGVAKDIAAAFPQAYFADINTGYGDLGKLGHFSKGSPKTGGAIYNLYGQYRYGREEQQTDYGYIKNALEEAVLDAMACGYVSMGLPFKMGCNNGGGDWSEVMRLAINPIEEIIKIRDFQLFIYKKY